MVFSGVVVVVATNEVAGCCIAPAVFVVQRLVVGPDSTGFVQRIEQGCPEKFGGTKEASRMSLATFAGAVDSAGGYWLQFLYLQRWFWK